MFSRLLELGQSKRYYLFIGVFCIHLALDSSRTGTGRCYVYAAAWVACKAMLSEGTMFLAIWKSWMRWCNQGFQLHLLQLWWAASLHAEFCQAEDSWAVWEMGASLMKCCMQLLPETSSVAAVGWDPVVHWVSVWILMTFITRRDVTCSVSGQSCVQAYLRNLGFS